MRHGPLFVRERKRPAMQVGRMSSLEMANQPKSHLRRQRETDLVDTSKDQERAEQTRRLPWQTVLAKGFLS